MENIIKYWKGNSKYVVQFIKLDFVVVRKLKVPYVRSYLSKEIEKILEDH